MPRNVKTEKLRGRNVLLGLAGALFIAGVVIAGNIAPKPAPAVAPAEKASAVFTKLNLSARAAFVYDAKLDRPLYGMNSEAELPLASLTKIMTAVAALDIMPKDAVIVIDAASLRDGEGDSGLYGNERWRLSDLLGLTLVESANAGANAIAATGGKFIERELAGTAAGAAGAADQTARFVSAMNGKAQALGLRQTYFLNPSGLDESASVSGGYGSARDVSVLFAYALAKYPNIFENTTYRSRRFTSLSNFSHEVKNTNIFVGAFPSLLAGKTGYTDLAHGNLTIAFDAGPNHPIVVTVLGSTERGRFTDAEKLVWATLDYLQS